MKGKDWCFFKTWRSGEEFKREARLSGRTEEETGENPFVCVNLVSGDLRPQS